MKVKAKKPVKPNPDQKNAAETALTVAYHSLSDKGYNVGDMVLAVALRKEGDAGTFCYVLCNQDASQDEAFLRSIKATVDAKLDAINFKEVDDDAGS